MQKLIYHPEAGQEIISSSQYYESQVAGLGVHFVEDFEYAISEIEKSPLTWPILESDIRRHQLGHFPFGVIYRIQDNTIRVLAIMHLHRHPGYWKSRR
ncbi:MAG: type II toxin-antitoxin system RelE/ParE family toxin [Victivallales bacterium]